MWPSVYDNSSFSYCTRHDDGYTQTMVYRIITLIYRYEYDNIYIYTRTLSVSAEGYVPHTRYSDGMAADSRYRYISSIYTVSLIENTFEESYSNENIHANTLKKIVCTLFKHTVVG